MVRKIKLIVAGLILALGFTSAFASPAFAAGGAAGEAKNDVCKGILSAGGNCSDNGSGLTGVIKVIINILSIVAGVAAVIMIIIGGLRYITSGGDSSGVASAKNTIIYAVVGLVVVAMAQFIVRFVLGKAT